MSTLPCPKQHWSRFSVLLDEGMDLPEGGREDWLRALGHEDAELRPWLARVLSSAASVNTADFLETPGIPAALLDDFSAGDVLGPYRLVELLGEGGMGRVWRASRADDGPTREVALKLPHAELLAGPFRTRFRRERDVLAGLSHPNIAALYDAGVSAEGHPYLALELVCGQTITAHCKAVGCSLERRVDLLRQMLAALGYAHSRLIVHRDIKPSNVLVTDDGTVKLLDFGIAKLLDGTSEDGQKLTQAASRLATPGYAPPEQMDGGPITVTTDLFAAGVLMFELCTGTHPPRLRADDEALPLASSKADALAGNLPEGVNLRRRLRGDLDAIMAKALSGDPAERYHSADAFARDLRRWQDGLPVSARHIGPAARAAKFVRRNRAAVALGGLLSVALVGGVAGIVWQAHRAEHEAARAVAVKDFMIGLFQQSDPGDSGKRFDTMTARDMLDAGVVRADTDFAAHPGIEIEVLETIANIFDWADESERAEKVYARRLAVAKAAFGSSDPRTIESALASANSQVMFLDEDHAKALLESVRGPVFNAFGPSSLQRATWLQSHARVLRATHGAREMALADAAASVAIFERYFPNDRHYHEAMLDLEDYQYDNEDFIGSLATLERLRAHDIATHNYSETDDLVFHTDQASRLEKLGRLKEADAIWFIAERQSEKLFGKNSLWYLHALTSWAQMIHLAGDRARADKMLEEGLAIGKGGASPSGQSTSVLRLYGVALTREGRAAEAVPILEKVLEQTELHGHDEQNLRRTQGMLGDAYDQVGRTDDARPLLRTAREDWLKYGPVHGSFAQSARERWARFLLDHGDSKGAEAEFRAVLAQGPGYPEAAASLAHAGLARIALAGGSTGVADLESAAAVESVEKIKMEFDTRTRADIWLVRADVLAAEGHHDAALGFAQRAQAAIAVWDAAGSPRAVRAGALVGKLAEFDSHL